MNRGKGGHYDPERAEEIIEKFENILEREGVEKDSAVRGISTRSATCTVSGKVHGEFTQIRLVVNPGPCYLQFFNRAGEKIREDLVNDSGTYLFDPARIIRSLRGRDPKPSLDEIAAVMSP